MKCNMNTYENLESLINYLKTNEEVVGIVEYGGRTYKDMSLGGDYDLTIILNNEISSNFNGVHFHIGDIPVDCMILSVNDFEIDEPMDPFYLVHLNCNIIYDREGLTKKLIDRVKKHWTPNPVLTSYEKHLFRFSFQHVLDKLENRLYDDELFSRFFIHSSFDWFLECYARINNLQIGQPKLHINHMKENSKDLYNTINELYNTLDLSKQFELLKNCADVIMEPEGGLWRKDEILLHLNPNGEVIPLEEKKVIELIFGTAS